MPVGIARLLVAAAVVLASRSAFAIADPVTQDDPLWFVPRGTAVVDGVLDDADWATAYRVERTQPSRDDGAVVIEMMYSEMGLYLAADVRSRRLWADGIGNGAGNRWEVEQDASVTFYFDPDHSRDEYLSANDRAFGVNLGNVTDPVNQGGGGIVRRWKLVRGNGTLFPPDLNPNGALTPGLLYASVPNGTVNSNADVDTGWATEMFLPWAALNMAAPANGTVIGMNFDVIFDNEGGFRDLTDNRNNLNPLLPLFGDDYVVGSHSSYDSTQAGSRGPVGYASAMFVDAASGTVPAAISDLAVDSVGAFGARLGFTAPAGTQAGQGFAGAYAIRYATVPIIDEPSWVAASGLEQRYVPRRSGSPESLRLPYLQPSVSYHVAVRAVDPDGGHGPLSNAVSFSTPALPSPGYKGRIIPSPLGGALIFENGTPFVAVGDHLGLSWAYTRQLFPGDVWDDVFQVFQNFSENVPGEGPFGPYFDELQARGLNTMRVYLELQNVHYEGNPSPPNGLMWLEHDAGVFNDDMRDFLLNVLAEAGSRGIYVIFSPFDSFSYDDAFGQEGPWATNFGGPLGSINNFFQTPQTLDLARARMDAVIGWVNASPWAEHVIGWEPVSEWDSWEWTLNAEGNGQSGREVEMRRRAQWIDDLALHIRQQDPDHLVLNSTIVRDPRGPVARLVFFSRNFDALTPHLYTNSNDGPINNPQADKSVQPALDNGISTHYFVSNRIDHAPVVNGEWGMTRAHWPGGVPQYSAAFTQPQDEANIRTMMWSGLASGQAGMGLRINTEELAFTGYVLTDEMQDLQQTFAAFITGTRSWIDYDRILGRPLPGLVTASAAGHSLLGWGVSDREQGVAYVLRDGNVGGGTVSGANLTVAGLAPGANLRVDFWSTAAGTSSPLATTGAVVQPDGRLSLGLPSFSPDLVVAFAPEPGSAIAGVFALLGLASLARRRRR